MTLIINNQDVNALDDRMSGSLARAAQVDLV
jgi:hypothetical protein